MKLVDQNPGGLLANDGLPIGSYHLQGGAALQVGDDFRVSLDMENRGERFVGLDDVPSWLEGVLSGFAGRSENEELC